MKSYVIILCLLLLMGCNSNDDGPNCIEDFTGPLTVNEEMLTGTWQLTALMAEEAVDLTDDGENNPSTDIFGQYDDCGQDLSFTFRADRSYTYSQGATTEGCDASVASSTGTWKFTGEVLNLVTNCILQPNALSINAAEDEFTLTYNNVAILQADGSQTTTQVVYTYSKNQ